MSSWNAMTYEGKDTILRVVRNEAEQFFAMVDSDEAWEAPTGAGHWQVRDLVGHIVDTTEAYFVAFDAARGGDRDARGVRPARDGGAGGRDGQALRSEPRAVLVERLRADFDKMMGILEALTEDDWSNLIVSHFYMGPLPAFFYPAFQLMDYGVHSWDIRQGTGRAHGLSGEAADLLVPFMFVLWQYTTQPRSPDEPCELGIRITSRAERRRHPRRRRPGGLGLRAGRRVDDVTVIEFDPGSFVLTAFGRSNAGHDPRRPRGGRPLPEPLLPDLRRSA